MNPRERTLAAVLIGLIALAVCGGAGYLFVLQPLAEKTSAADKLEADLEKTRADLTAADIRSALSLYRLATAVQFVAVAGLAAAVVCL